QQRLAQPGDALQEGVAADEQAGEDAVHDVGVADDHLADLAVHLPVGLAELVGALLHLGRVCHGWLVLRWLGGWAAVAGPALPAAFPRRTPTGFLGLISR